MSSQITPGRVLSSAERAMLWRRPPSHIVSLQEGRVCAEIRRCWNDPELRITNILLEGDAGSGKTQLAKALSAELGLPYTKITCFADMDKTDVIGAVLPVLSAGQMSSLPSEDQGALEAIYGFQGMGDVLQYLEESGTPSAAGELRRIIALAQAASKERQVEYRFYPSEIVRAYQNGYLLEIQEPTVIRDAAVLMALNSALEPDGSISLPTETVHRHHDFVAVITTNRGYAGCRPLNEALRDRIQHTEKMDLPPKPAMVARAAAKTGFADENALALMADCIILLDQAARKNAIKGVAGMRSYFYWAQAVSAGGALAEELYYKVIYKITTDSEEVAMLEDALKQSGLYTQLEDLGETLKKNGFAVRPS